MSPAPTFELLGFEATPVSPAVAVVELEGRFDELAPAMPRLLVEAGGVARELPALAVGDAETWSATFAIPLATLTDPGATFALAPARGPLIVLPAPTQSGGDDDRFVRLARTANDLRHELQSAAAAAAAAEARVAEAQAERDGLAAELAAAREQAAVAQRRSEESHAAAVAAREEQARAEGEADETRAEAERARLAAEAEIGRARSEAEAEVARVRAEVEEQARAAIERAEAEAAAAREQLADAQDRAIAAEDEAHAARRELRDARARVESLLRQARTTRSAAARTRVPSAAAEDEFRAARLGRDWADGVEEDDEDETLDDDRAGRLAGRGEGDEDEPTGRVAGRGEGDEDEPAAGLAGRGEGSEGEGGSGDGGVASGDSGDDDPAASPAGGARANGAVSARDSSGDYDDTASFEPVAGEPPTTAQLPASGLWADDEADRSVRVLRPRTNAGRLRPTRVVPTPPEDDDALDPAAVGARLIRPAETSPRHRGGSVLANPRVIVGTIFLLLFVALVLIFAGVGPV